MGRDGACPLPWAVGNSRSVPKTRPLSSTGLSPYVPDLKLDLDRVSVDQELHGVSRCLLFRIRHMSRHVRRNAKYRIATLWDT